MSEQAMREAFERCMALHWNDWEIAWQAALQWAAEGQEPVAWMPAEGDGEPVSDAARSAVECCKKLWPIPLYAAPVPNELQAEVERLRKALHQITKVEPGTVTTTFDMRRIASEALAKGE